MADFSLMHGGGNILKVGTGTSGYLLNVAAGSSAHVKGAWVQLVASSVYDASAIMFTHVQNSLDRHLTDIGIGATSSEVVIVPNIMEYGEGSDRARHQYTIWPVEIPAGTRIVARTQNHLGASRIIAVQAWLIPRTLHWGSGSANRVTAHGASTAATKGTTVVVGFSGAKGSWVQLNASTATGIKALYMRIGSDLASTADAVYAIDIGIGAAASEVVVVPDIPATTSLSPDVLSALYAGPFYVDIPAGTRIAARASVDAASGTQDFDIIVYGVG